MKHYIISLLLFFFVNNAITQTTKILAYKDIPVLFNLDSLENEVVAKKHNATELFFAMAALEKSRNSYYSLKFGKYILKIDSLANILNNDNAKATSLILDMRYRLSNNSDKSLLADICYKAIDLGTLTKDTFLTFSGHYSLFLSNIKGNVTNIFKLNNSSENFAKKSFDEITKLAANSNDTLRKIYYYLACCKYYAFIEVDRNKEMEASKKALNYISNNPNYDYFKPYICSIIATIYNAILDAYNTIKSYESILSMPLSKDAYMYSFIYYGMSDAYNTLGKYDSAKLYCNKAIRFMTNVDTNNLVILGSCYYLLGQIEYNLKNYKAAYEAKLLDDSVFNVRTTKDNGDKFVDLEHKYEADKKEQANITLKKEQAQYKKIVIVGALVFTFIAILSIAFYRQKNRLKRLMLFRDKIHSIISHDLRSPFAALQDLNEQASFYLKTNDIKQFNRLAHNIDSTSIKISNLLNNLLQWAIANNKKGMQSNINLNVASVINNVIQLYTNTIENKKIVVNKPINNNIEINASKNVIELIIRNWLDNILKYSNATEVNFIVENNKNATTIIIQDNGNINEDVATIIKNQLAQSSTIKMENDTGLGLGLIAYFAKENKFNILFNTALNNNTFNIKISKV